MSNNPGPDENYRYGQPAYGEREQQPQYGQQEYSLPNNGFGYTRDFQSVAGQDTSAYPRDASGLPLKGFPVYGANSLQSLKMFFRNYANPRGYASRSEYWWVTLILFVIGSLPLLISAAPIFSAVIDNNDPSDTSVTIFGIFFVWGVLVAFATIVPCVMLTIRRLHDAGFSGFFYLLSFIPYIGGLILTVFMLLPTRFDKRDPRHEPETFYQG